MSGRTVDASVPAIPTMADVSPTSGYLRCGEQRLFSVFHPPAAPAQDLAILVCPPFGWEEVCSHRVLREWSRRLALTGHASLRWTLPGFGDSTGTPENNGLFGDWIRATDVAARWLRDASGAQNVVALGLGLGGMLAYCAAAGGSPIDGFVLWGVASRGRDFVRQTRAFSRMESSEFFIGLPPPVPLPEGTLEAGGFLLSRPTVEQLSTVNLSELEAPVAPLGALLLERDGIAVDERLRSALAESSIDADIASGEGYAEMASHPQQSHVPETVIDTVARWLTARSEPRAGADPEEPPRETTLAIGGDRPTATEAPFELEVDGDCLRGILCAPSSRSSSVCAVFLNAGAQRRIGPNRMWVEAARRWAPAGAASLRLDMFGIGESDGPTTPYARDMTLYGPEYVPRVIAALDELQRRGVADRFILVGLCAGAYWALHGGLQDDRVVSIMMLNPVAVIWDDEISAARDLRRVFTDRSWRLIRKNATPQRVKAVVTMLAGLPVRLARRLIPRTGALPSLETRIEANLDQWRHSQARIMAMFALREGLAMDLERTGRLSDLERLPNVTIHRIPVNDHTLRPVTVQRHVHEQLDAELYRVLDALGTGAAPAEIAQEPNAIL